MYVEGFPPREIHCRKYCANCAGSSLAMRYGISMKVVELTRTGTLGLHETQVLTVSQVA